MPSVLPVPPSVEVVVGPSVTPRVPPRRPASGSPAGWSTGGSTAPGSYRALTCRPYSGPTYTYFSEASRPSRAADPAAARRELPATCGRAGRAGCARTACVWLTVGVRRPPGDRQVRGNLVMSERVAAFYIRLDLVNVVASLNLSMTAHTRRPKVFISYSHADDELRRPLEAHLAQLRRQGLIESWWATDVESGQEWS